MGYLGSCTATLATFWAMTGAIGLAMRFDRGLRLFRLVGPVDWRVLGEMATLGWPISLLLLVEITLFTVAALIIGMFGETPLAAHQISMNCAAVTFMVPLAISQAVNVRVGYHAGAQMPRAARLSGVVGFLLGVGFMSLTSAVLLCIPSTIADLFITAGDPNRSEVVGLSVRLLTIAAAFQIFDGAQVIAVGALRGLKDTRTPAIIAGFGYWAIGFTTAWTLGVRFGYGVAGIWWGLAAGLAAVAILLSLRFWATSARMIRRGSTATDIGARYVEASVAE
jgi:MATE family multidrug resistance protein